MENKIRKNGNYELFQTTKKHTILTLDQKEWYAVVKGQQGDIMVGSDSDHEKSRTVGQGKYILVEFEDDPEFRDMPHLFLQKGSIYEEWILPRELPSQKGDKVKVVKTKIKVDEKKIEDHIRNSGRKSEGDQDLRSKNRKDLLELAREKDIKGRTRMKKDELVEALS